MLVQELSLRLRNPGLKYQPQLHWSAALALTQREGSFSRVWFEVSHTYPVDVGEGSASHVWSVVSHDIHCLYQRDYMDAA